jgi:uroporphyrin-III C-methyltransferase/precorrin-2 dehydrogenase/sirohydrochlorin ferrochelatase
MNHFPVFLSLKGKPCTIIGGGAVAERKTESLLKAKAKVTLISPQLTAQLAYLVEDGQINYIDRCYQTHDIKGSFLVIAATNQKETNQLIAEYADQHNILINVVDNPTLCNFIVPSVLDRSPVTVAVSTGGASPVLARQLRMKLESMIPSSCGELAALTEEYREQVKQKFTTVSERKNFWENVLRGTPAELVYAGQIDEARALLEQLLAKKINHAQLGEVYLVGAGPGDPDLLTFKAVRLMQRADVMVYDA